MLANPSFVRLCTTAWLALGVQFEDVFSSYQILLYVLMLTEDICNNQKLVVSPPEDRLCCHLCCTGAYIKDFLSTHFLLEGRVQLRSRQCCSRRKQICIFRAKRDAG